jgi:ribosomal protein S8
MVCDPIADMFTRIRNALMVKHAEVVIPHSKLSPVQWWLMHPISAPWLLC